MIFKSEGDVKIIANMILLSCEQYVLRFKIMYED